MFERLTAFLPAMEEGDFGKKVQRRDEDTGYLFPLVLYEWKVRRLTEAVFDFADDHMEEKIGDFGRILEENRITWSMESMKKADVSALDGRAVYALLMGAVRAEDYCCGALLEFCESGCVKRWLARLKEIDGQYDSE